MINYLILLEYKRISCLPLSTAVEFERLQRRMVHQKMYCIWKVAQSENLDGLTEEEIQVARIMLEHKEYNDDFSDIEYLADYEYNHAPKITPFMHIGIHLTVENQLKQREPEEVCEFYNAMQEKDIAHHEIIHLICSILVPLVFDTLKHLKPFDSERYTGLLVKHRDTDPEMLEALIHKEFEADKKY